MIVQYDLLGNKINQFASVKEAAIKTRCIERLIHYVIRGDRRHTGGYVFKKEGDNTFIKFQTPKILLLDIETIPMEVFVWGLYKQRIPHDNVIKDWVVLSWAGKWLYNTDTFGDILTPNEAVNRDDLRILSSLWDILDKADIVITHNGIRFDIRKINARFLYHGFGPPSTFKQIDTLVETQKAFSTSSHKLDFLSKFIGRKGKLATSFELWKGCMRGDIHSLNYMFKYNKEDVTTLEDLYLEVRPWIKNHPNIGLYMNTYESICPSCGSTNIESKGFYYTSASKFESFHCNDCHSTSRKNKTLFSKAKKDNLLIPTAH